MESPFKLEVKVLSYNLNLLPKGVNPVGHRYKTARLKEFVRCLPDYDVVALQEVFSTPFLLGWGCRQKELIRIAYKHGFSFVRSTQPRLWDIVTMRKVTDSGLLILSKFPIVESGSMQFQQGAHMDAGAAKGGIYALLKIGNAHLLVFNTHLQATHSSSGSSSGSSRRGIRGSSAADSAYDSIRYHQLVELRRFIHTQSHMNGKNVPWILTGDFNIDAISRPAVADEYGYVYDNTSIESEEYKKMVAILDPTGHVRDLLKECNGGEHPPTRPPRLEFPSSVDLVFKHKYPQRLDYIFFMGGDEESSIQVPFCDNAEKKHTVVVPFVVKDKRYYSHISDHYGIQTTLTYEGKDEEEALLFSTEKTFGNIFSEPAPVRSQSSSIDTLDFQFFSREGQFWSYLYTFLLLALIFVIAHGFGWIDLSMSTLVKLLMGLLLFIGWKLYRFWKKRRKRRRHGFMAGYGGLVSNRLGWRPFTQTNIKDPIGVYDEIAGEGPAHRSPHFPDQLLDVSDSKVATLYENFKHAVKHYGYRPCLGTRSVNSDGTRGPYKWITYDDLGRRMSNFGSGLYNLGLRKGSLLGICSENRTEWIVADLACNSYSFVSVPLFEAENYYLPYVIKHAQLTVIVCSRSKTFKLLEVAQECPSLRILIQMEPIQYEESYLADKQQIKLIPFTFVEKDGIREPQSPDPPHTNDLATILYDINTRGEVKGIMLSHNNLLVGSKALIYQGRSKLKLTCDDVHFSYFPLRLRVERSVVTLMFSVGGSVGFCQEDNSKLFDDIQKLRPTILFGLPGMFIRLYRKYKIIISSWWGPKRWLFSRIYMLKQEALKQRRNTEFWNRALFRRFSSRLGGRVRLIVVLSDGLMPSVHKEFLQICFCCSVSQCYAKTALGVATCSSLDCFSEDEQAGYPMPCNEIKLQDVKSKGWTSHSPPERGRIKIRGSNVMVGYYKEQSLTEERISKDGWLLTNEIGQWNVNGSLTILGHEQGVLEPVKGQIVFNKYLENLYLESTFVQQIWVTCKRYRPLVAIIVPDFELLFWWAKENNIQHDFRISTLCEDPRLKSAVLKDLRAVADSHTNVPFALSFSHLSASLLPSLSLFHTILTL
ncbi:Long-chain-fatty-acid--CoA ligase 6, variant 2 [Balamuthia mandrillaris]